MNDHLLRFPQRGWFRHEPDAITLSLDLRLYQVSQAAILPWLGAIVHRPTDRIIGGRPGLEPRLAGRPVLVPGASISLIGSSRGHNHYYHFFEAMAVLRRALSWLDPQEPLTLLVRETLSPFQNAAIEALTAERPGLSVMAVSGDRIVEPERLLIARWFTPHAINRFALTEEWRWFGPALSRVYGLPAPAPDRRIYLTRRHQRLRRFTNEPAVEALLTRRGYETIAPEQLDHRSQVALMGRCEALAAASGAALTNMLFASPGLLLTVIAPREIDEPFWEALALILGHRLRYLETGMVGLNDHHSVDLARLDQALSL
jgi:hypothetical protein